MTAVLFYEKPGCATNARQKRALAKAGHEVIARDLIAENWTEAGLRAFVAKLPVADWFNRAAPDIKSGRIDPSSLNETAAIAALLANHLLIRRPLMVIGETRLVGYDEMHLANLLDPPPVALAVVDAESCSRRSEHRAP